MPIVERYLEGSGSGVSLADIYGQSKQKSMQTMFGPYLNIQAYQ